MQVIGQIECNHVPTILHYFGNMHCNNMYNLNEQTNILKL